jgi:hypothetical protein
MNPSVAAIVAAWLAMFADNPTAATPSSGAVIREMGRRCNGGWRAMMSTWHEGTGLVYGCPPEQVRPSTGAVNGMFPWTAETGYGAGMSDCALICGTALSGLVDRFAALGDDESGTDAAKVARGVLNLAKLHGVRGFVARGLCADDARTICSLSSRDQFTHWVHGLWRYSCSPMADPSLVSEYRTLVADVAGFMEERVTPERGWNFGLADGGEDPRGICTMWGPDLAPHEDTRLPAIYAAASMATGDAHWRNLYEGVIDEALDRTLRIDGPDRAQFLSPLPCYSLYQANASLELLLAFEGGNPSRREKIERAMRAFSAIAADKARRALQNPDAAPPYGMCWDGELALAMLLTPGVPDAEVVAPLLARAVGYSDLAESGVIRASHVMAAFWRWRAGVRTGTSGAAQ